MKKVVLFICIGLISIGIFLYFLVFNDNITLNLIGKDNINLEVNTEYNDEGIILKNNNKPIESKYYKITKNSNLNTSTLGTFTINYQVTYKNKNYNLTRHINIVDTTAPIIEISSENVQKDYCTKKIIDKFTYTATDNYDGDITDKVETIENDNKLVLKVKDTSNNESSKEVNITFKEKPKNKFTLNGNSKVYVLLNGTYNEQGASYTDGCGNKINTEIKTEGSVNPNEIGTYKITYRVDNETLTRTIIVHENSEIINTNNKVIYLTFDDGPGYYTNKVLNTLDKYNVKATFFVTSQFPSYLHLIKEEYDKGHTVAVHTYTHKYDIYTNIDTFLNDFNKMNEIIKEYTGSYTNLFRFPGGSSNTVSKSYNKGIMTKLAKKMQEDGYIYFDWNVSSGDASGAGSTKIYNNVVNGIKSCNKCVVLMHDIKSTTANALDDILNTLTSTGYTFSTLNENSPTAHHGINN